MLCAVSFRYFQEHLKHSPYNYLEIGIYNGDGPCLLAKEFPNKTIYTIDPFIEDGHTTQISGVQRNEKLSRQKTNFLSHKAALTNIVHFEMTSFDFLQSIKGKQEEIDKMNIGNVLIDGSHHYEDILIDIELVRLLTHRHETHIIFDDYNDKHYDVKRAVNYFRANYAIKKETPLHDGTFLLMETKWPLLKMI
ncbi:MAG: class I SAM-dependent methyltransferase [Proteobacteria bacterium]|jgi:hypothetical protein|nr:class I SAM-dependent methyltransferase [Pseudomonadota bacterium]